MNTPTLQDTIEAAWEHRAGLEPDHAPVGLRKAVEEVIDALDRGTLRVAERIEGDWRVHQWIKKAVLLSFRLAPNRVMGQSPQKFYDKVPLKFQDYDQTAFEEGGFRAVPTATVRRGAYIGADEIGRASCRERGWRY